MQRYGSFGEWETLGVCLSSQQYNDSTNFPPQEQADQMLSPQNDCPTRSVASPPKAQSLRCKTHRPISPGQQDFVNSLRHLGPRHPPFRRALVVLLDESNTKEQDISRPELDALSLCTRLEIRDADAMRRPGIVREGAVIGGEIPHEVQQHAAPADTMVRPVYEGALTEACSRVETSSLLCIPSLILCEPML